MIKGIVVLEAREEMIEGMMKIEDTMIGVMNIVMSRNE